MPVKRPVQLFSEPIVRFFEGTLFQVTLNWWFGLVWRVEPLVLVAGKVEAIP